MTLDTRIPGDAAALRTTGEWLRTRLRVEVIGAADGLYSARSVAKAGWLGMAGDAFVTRVELDARAADDLADATDRGARGLDELATELARVQAEMAEIRLAAAAAGLTVDGETVLPPGPSPPNPGPAPIGPAATQQAVDAHTWAIAAAARHRELVAAWAQAVTSAERARRGWGDVQGSSRR